MKSIWKLLQLMDKKGHNFYETKQAKELFAKQLISLSEKAFWAAIAPLFGVFISPDKININYLIVAVCTFIAVGIYLRHQGLLIIDDVNSGKIKIIKP
ncbi:hypothetical protein [Desulfuromonas acetoxidans]|uniref:hypothetical protein n=1 Tax=Desulfuromonas acetoxidans TaxID=891 RepID=UPI00292F8DF3|nr:hypothetical protein [Desulfuromonas acetoxidans]